VVMIRAWGKIKGFKTKEVFDQIFDTENRQKWDTITNNLRIIESPDENTDIIHFIIKVSRNPILKFYRLLLGFLTEILCRNETISWIILKKII
jgi:hypothetical protein